MTPEDYRREAAACMDALSGMPHVELIAVRNFLSDRVPRLIGVLEALSQTGAVAVEGRENVERLSTALKVARDDS